MGALRTSEDAVVVAGEGKKAAAEDDRSVDGGAKIIIAPGPMAPQPQLQPAVAPRPVPRPAPTMPAARRTGFWVVVTAYVLATAALAAAIYERFVA